MTDGGVRLGSILFSLVEPEPGHERAFHRWYERDHFYAGMMSGPDLFAGRRWLATRALKTLRYPADSPVVDDLARGSFAVTYWILADRHEAFVRWAVERVHALHAAGRMFRQARQLHTGFYAFRWSVGRDADGVPPELALDHPYAGLVAVVVDPEPGAEAAPLESWLRDGELRGTPAGQCLAFAPLPLPDDAPANTPRITPPEGRTLLLYFLDESPERCWKPLFSECGRRVAEAGLGRVSFAAPFVPTVPGTDRHLDQL